MDEELKEILREAFGDSSSDVDSDSSYERRERLQFGDPIDEIAKTQSIFGESCCWEPITGINGLWICRGFLSPDQQSSLLSALEKEGYFAEASHNQAMRFGDLPCWAIELSYNIRENVRFSGCVPEYTDSITVDENEKICPFPLDMLWREPLFNQLIVNIYQPGEGICAHIDLMRFEDGIAIISLESSCVMHFTRVECETSHIEKMNEGCTSLSRIPVLLVPGSLVLMWGEARYLWKHQINRKPGFQLWEGQEIEQKRRTSVTLRRFCRTG
ncbi:alkylated DNA repair protein ALKBH8 homolog [Primulina huaijiensis]|uniref:alkylated DNA repair protein ALKBH8 homolog n=1 Tax=Primulina huaijiensis TaxID=1492673 RepID=UPI003CC70AC6